MLLSAKSHPLGHQKLYISGKKNEVSLVNFIIWARAVGLFVDCAAENDENISIFPVPGEMHGASLRK